MKYIVLLLVFCGFCASSSLAQNGNWKPEQLIALFRDTTDVPMSRGEHYPFNQIKDNTLSLGTWKGVNWGTFHSDEFSIHINQISPVVKGTFEMLVRQIEAQDTLRGLIRGIATKNRIVLAVKYIGANRGYDIMEGKSFTVERSKGLGIQIFSGMIEDENLKNASKEQFMLYKEH
ncbi:MAG: hypothetical protein Q8916_09700 [Bacteroidota bacterium]|nr:hypothetical protein [Bacteroidota bacterium]MDP4230663.1 hypothetical protein [Bacteroidota bacterium]MDP4235018.1 hypothetical protein [Bacteroidota bacterium]